MRKGSKESEPVSTPLVVVEEQPSPESVSSDWVVQNMTSSYNVGLSCERFGDELMVLFTAIKASRHQNGPASSPSSLSKSMNRGQCELKRLVCSINYDF